MVGKRSAGERLFDGLNVLLMFLVILMTLYPFLYVLFASLSRPELFTSHTGLVYKPVGFTWAAYRSVFLNKSLLNSFRNTLLYVTTGTALNMVMTTLGAYVLSRRGYMLKKLFNLLVLIPMFFGGGLIPSYLVALQLNLVDSPLAMILPNALNIFNMIILRTAFSEVPDALPESARIDGARETVILLFIVLPVTLPTLAVIVLYYAVAHWNSWFNAVIYLRSRNLFPLQLILREILILGDTNEMIDIATLDQQSSAVKETVKYATIIVTTAPILLLYPFLQRYFIKGVMIGAVKG
ncbi:MAG TPA: carbohydrate ABC transporter permease [Clostridia bacterium]|nr:carbohydrate ABC transporter permease [Clostridia bacterium]